MPNTQKLLAICGISGPIIFAIVILTLGHLTPNYSHFTQHISELGAAEAPYALPMNILGFSLLGFSLIAFSIGIHKGIKHNRNIDTIGPVLIALSGLGLMATAAFPCDLGCNNQSFTGTMHSYSATVTGFFMAIAPFATAYRFSKDKNWRSYTHYTLLTGILGAILGIVLFFSPPGLDGLFQKMAMAVPLVWVEVVSIRLFRMD